MQSKMIVEPVHFVWPITRSWATEGQSHEESNAQRRTAQTSTLSARFLTILDEFSNIGFAILPGVDSNAVTDSVSEVPEMDRLLACSRA
jgi:hypothetical protein